MLGCRVSTTRLSTVMPDIFSTRFYRINDILLSLVGLWPYQKYKSWQLFQQIMCQLVVCTLFSVEAIKLLEEWGDLDIMIECLTPMGVQLSAVIKSMNMLVYRKQMTELMEIINEDWSNLKNPREIEIFVKYGKDGRRLTIVYTVFLYGSAFLYCLIPLLPKFLDIVIPRNESRAPITMYRTEYFVDPDKYDVWILLHTYSATAVVMTEVISADTIFACFVTHTSGVLAVIGHRLENLISKSSGTAGSVRILSTAEDEKCHREIVHCIKQHYRAIEIANVIQSSYSISFLLVIGLCMVILSLSAVQLLIKFGDIEEMIRLFPFNLAQFFHLFFCSWPCQKLIDQSDTFRESLYSAEWYSLSEENKYLFRFVMLRALEPQKITAGKVYDMSMENFAKVIQTSMSYFTVFASIQE